MTFTDTDELLGVLLELRRAQPELRLGQLVASLTMIARGNENGAVWEVEDAELAEAARWQLNQLGFIAAVPV
jgi:hypothetical protein